MNPAVLEATIQSVLGAASNNEPVTIKEEWIEEAGEEFKTALRKQFTPRDPEFKVRMSNIGRPLCQLQRQKEGAPAKRMPYNHVMRMLVGDSTEVLVRFVLKAAGVNVTSHGDSVTLPVSGQIVKGDSDIDIDDAVWDIKSCSPWAFKNKWAKGYPALREQDDFGYVGQLLGYADAQDKPAGGWIVVDKSSGEVKAVPMEATPGEANSIRAGREATVEALRDGKPFRRGYSDEPELFRGNPTGARRIAKSCTFCNYMGSCWPDARLLSNPASKAKEPALNWYSAHPDMPDAD